MSSNTLRQSATQAIARSSIKAIDYSVLCNKTWVQLSYSNKSLSWKVLFDKKNSPETLIRSHSDDLSKINVLGMSDDYQRRRIHESILQLAPLDYYRFICRPMTYIPLLNFDHSRQLWKLLGIPYKLIDNRGHFADSKTPKCTLIPRQILLWNLSASSRTCTIYWSLCIHAKM